MAAIVPATLECRALTVTVPGRTLVADLDLRVEGGEFLAVLGQNGAGKSLTLQTLAGLRQPAAGSVWLDAAELAAQRRQHTARRLTLLPQIVEDIFPASVLDTALIGRHPYIGQLRWESAEDIAIATSALERMGLDDLAQRDVLSLSGGERRRLAIAQILTQDPAVYLLDEPTNHLDPQHQLDSMCIFRGAVDAGAAVVASLHDVNLAARFADRCLLLFGDGHWRLGSVAEVLDEDSLSELFATRMQRVPWNGRDLFVATR